jgi:hypothetical protein
LDEHVGIIISVLVLTHQQNATTRMSREASMLTLTTGLLLLAVIVVALYAFGVFDTPYLGAFRFTFYLLLVLLALAVWYGSMNPSKEGYDPTVGAR